MERVKPIYLSRTYGVPLPDPSDPLKGWAPEAFMDKLARMKGRLLKKGEPDMEAVAKILLSDWVRGRIPFFVPPPERPEELNEKEEKARKRAEKMRAADAKGKGKAKDGHGEQRPVGVKQRLGSIMQKNTFVGEDVRPLEEEDHDEVEDEDAEQSVDDAVEGEEEEEELSWNDVFKGDAPEGEITTLFSKLGDDEEEDASASEQSEKEADDVVDAESESEQSPKKETRMKTNKVRNTYNCCVSLYVYLTISQITAQVNELLLNGKREEQES